MIGPSLIKHNMAAKPHHKKIILSCPCHIHSVLHFVRGADPTFSKLDKVPGSLALSAHGLPKLRLWASAAESPDDGRTQVTHTSKSN